MQSRLIEGVELHRSSGNVFADLGLADAEKLKIKTGLVIEIRKAMKNRGPCLAVLRFQFALQSGYPLHHPSGRSVQPRVRTVSEKDLAFSGL